MNLCGLMVIFDQCPLANPAATNDVPMPIVLTVSFLCVSLTSMKFVTSNVYGQNMRKMVPFSINTCPVMFCSLAVYANSVIVIIMLLFIS